MSQAPYTRHNPVNIIDPDLPTPTLVKAWHQGVDKATGDHLVVIADEPEAIRRIKPQNVFRGMKVLPA